LLNMDENKAKTTNISCKLDINTTLEYADFFIIPTFIIERCTISPFLRGNSTRQHVNFGYGLSNINTAEAKLPFVIVKIRHYVTVLNLKDPSM